jgi:hypothetical protein
MNPTNHIKILLGILIIALTAFAVACGTAATDDSLTSGDPTVPIASVEIIEDSHGSETIALDAHDDGDAHETEAIALDTHDDGRCS